MISVNKLIKDAYDATMPGMYDSTDGTMEVVGVNELNRLISQLNSQGFIAMSMDWVDAPNARTIYFRKLAEGEALGQDTVDMLPPTGIDAVARRVGDRYVTLQSSNHVQMSWKNPETTATHWTYDVKVEQTSTSFRNVGVLTLDGNPRNYVRVWFMSQLPTYKLDDTIYLSDLYNELLMSGLCVRLADYYELSPEKKASLDKDFKTAKNLIKRTNINQRMLQTVKTIGDYNDPYYNGLAGAGM